MKSPASKPLDRRHTDRCIACEHPLSAASAEGLIAGIEAHIAYVNSQLDRQIDPHFTDRRLDALLQGPDPLLQP